MEMDVTRLPTRNKILTSCFAAAITGNMLLANPGAAEDTATLRTAPEHATPSMRAMVADAQPAQALSALSNVPCVNGMADIYPCENIDLLAFMPLAEVGGTLANSAASDIWGWTDPDTGKEYAILGRFNGTSFVDISDPMNPVYLGELPADDGHQDGGSPSPQHDEEGSFWRDIKVYSNHAFIVTEAAGAGMQVFDLTLLRDVVSTPATFTSTAHYHDIGSAHNIVINEDTGFAYAVGVSGVGSCGRGLHMIDISTPASPVGVGCFSADGYTHDAQCVVYAGPDTDHQGSEICFNANEDTLTIVDVSNKAAPVQLSRTGYPGSGYTHQGWLTPDQRYLLMGDELDELNFGHNTRTWIWDVSDLDNPAVANIYDSPDSGAIDHNLYTVGNYAFQSNYRAGLVVLDISDPLAPVEVANFDVYPANDNTGFNGSWSNYPYFESGVVVVSGIEQGLFILRPNLDQPPGPQLSISGDCPGPNAINLTGATPGGRVALLYARQPGSQVFPVGACAGTELGLGGLRVLTVQNADGQGELDINPPLPAQFCGTSLQALDMQSCETSNVVGIATP
jgi:choice-of-anchor B domain-containing protein